jgi:hypothetical protein
MKIFLLWGSGALLLLALLVVVTGYLLPARHVVSRSASFSATPEQIYALIAGPQNWRPGIAQSAFVEAPDHRLVLQETDRQGQTIAYEQTDVIPATSLKRRIVTEDLPYRGSWTYELKVSGGLTTLTITEDGEVDNPLFRFVARFIIGYTRTIDDYLGDLASAVRRPT